MPRGLNYKADLLDDLRSNPRFAAEYLSAAYVDSREAFLVALRDIAEAQKGVAQVAQEADINRENLYRILSKEGNPRLTSLRPVLGILGIGVQFTALRKTTARKSARIATKRKPRNWAISSAVQDRR
jgi:probable addiction module antidote protein